MSILYNDYQKIRQDNADDISKLKPKSWNLLKKMFDYISSFSVSSFELEVVKKELIGMALEADREEVDFKDYLGMPEKEFCDELIKDAMNESYSETIIPMIRNYILWLFILYTVFFFDFGFPKHFGVSSTVAFIALITTITGTSLEGRIIGRSAYKSKGKKQFTQIIMTVLCLAGYILFFLTSGNKLFIIEGNGWVIFFCLMILTIASALINNLFWNKVSKKYNWK